MLNMEYASTSLFTGGTLTDSEKELIEIKTVIMRTRLKHFFKMVKSIHSSEASDQLISSFKKPRVIIELFNEVAMKYLYDSKKRASKNKAETRFLEKLARLWTPEKSEDAYLHSPHFAAGQVHFRTLPHTILAHSYQNRSYLLFVNHLLEHCGESLLLKHMNVSSILEPEMITFDQLYLHLLKTRNMIALALYRNVSHDMDCGCSTLSLDMHSSSFPDEEIEFDGWKYRYIYVSPRGNTRLCKKDQVLVMRAIGRSDRVVSLGTDVAEGLERYRTATL